MQAAEHIARKEAKVRAARRRQNDADEVRARAERPEELFQHEREERDRLRAEKGAITIIATGVVWLHQTAPPMPMIKFTAQLSQKEPQKA